MTRAAGADMTEAPIRCIAGTPIDTYMARAAPLTVAKPQVRIQCNSDKVMFCSKGATASRFSAYTKK